MLAAHPTFVKGIKFVEFVKGRNETWHIHWFGGISRRRTLRPCKRGCGMNGRKCITRRIRKELQDPVSWPALAEDTGFWDRHDARLKALREADPSDPEAKM